MKEKVNNKKYKNFDQFKSDFEKICLNAIKYNEKYSFFYKEAERLI
jgi:hypothetical protein